MWMLDSVLMLHYCVDVAALGWVAANRPARSQALCLFACHTWIPAIVNTLIKDASHTVDCEDDKK